MKHGFIKAAAITPDLKVADPVYNSQVICQKIEEAEKEGAVLLVFPELCISGYTCHDLFLQRHGRAPDVPRRGNGAHPGFEAPEKRL